MNAAALAMDSLRVLCMRCCGAGTVRVTHKPAKVLTVIMRNFSPALPRLVQRNDVIKTPAGGISQ
ncbi:MAG TPA: hypothetical protein VFO22_08065 [Candidatus Udaeobacter sp.]|nr:hypothetical protein [Candidatus Udaeobacter sp.]